ncbi:hypothetical protein OTK49_03310 [Vibrio coralliirubri]|uniref:hypothetical protein n=1 Tax=Vibrio coralliirubri TaxID=1516159 RepID=UPI0022836CED|nr:hypothetical protein [Vibrio coralliirubri]MCY9861545.1 hypothetical protein [Vibrio coralliirubri]
MSITSLKEEIQSQVNTRYSPSEIKESKGHIYCVEPWDEGEDGFVAVVPAPMVEEFNYTFPTEAEAWAWLVTARELHPDGKNWEIDANSKEKCAESLFDLLADVCINDDEEIDENYLHFDKGTDRTEIWHWLEFEFNVSIAKLEGLA